jgi:putative endonuclease
VSHARKALGKWGEEQAEQYLLRKGMRIVERNWRIGRGEIDLIAWDGRTLVFVEVRTRAGLTFGTAAESVDWRKQRRLRELALHYLQNTRARSSDIRFDVITVFYDKGQRTAEIVHYAHAF